MINYRFVQMGQAALLKEIGVPVTTETKRGIELICDAIENFGITNEAQAAYILATVKHECGFRCIKEIRAAAGTAVWKMQEKYWHTGYYGRGYCQLTHKGNYEKFGKLLKMDLVKNPDLALDPVTSATILVLGMKNGLFSGKKLDDYINDKVADFVNARRIVNGSFQAERVADVAVKIQTLLPG